MPYNRWEPGLPMNIYKLINPIDGKVFYIGRTQRKLSYRILGHLSAGRSHGKGWANKKHSELISNILKVGQNPIIELVDKVDEINSEEDFSFSCYLEKFWILKYIGAGCTLTNGRHRYTMEYIAGQLTRIKNIHKDIFVASQKPPDITRNLEYDYGVYRDGDPVYYDDDY